LLAPADGEARLLAAGLAVEHAIRT
jgi:hypothetical protein